VARQSPGGGGTWIAGRTRPPRARAIEVFQRLNRLEAGTVGAEELTPEEVPFLRFDPAAQTIVMSTRYAWCLLPALDGRPARPARRRSPPSSTAWAAA
jgi:hypothetical protein